MEKEAKNLLWNCAINESIEKVREMGYTPIFCGIYGSPNYNLDIYDEDYKSDIDTKIIIIPTLEELVDNSKPISTTIDIKDGQCDIKDIRVFAQTLIKCNVQFLETLTSRCCWINPKYEEEVSFLIDNRDKLIDEQLSQLLKSVYGMCLEKEKALCHPYPTIKWKIDKWGYDGKQLHHILRLRDFLTNYIDNKDTFDSSIWYREGDRRNFLIQVKKNKLNLDEAVALANSTCKFVKEKVDKELLKIKNQDNNMIKNEYLSSVKNIIIKNIENQILDKYRREL